MVIGEDIEDQLSYYQENNMGNCPQEYMEFTDVTDEYMEQWESEGMDKVIMPDGRRLNKFDEEFRVDGSYGIGGSTHKVPEHLEIREVPFKELYDSFDDFISNYAGHEKDDITGRYGYWENPDAKWDWYEIGGRWAGMLKLKDDVSPGKYDTPNFSWGWDEKSKQKTIQKLMVDQAEFGDIDWEGMMDEDGKEAGERYDQIHKLLDFSVPHETWKMLRVKYEDDIDKVRKVYHEQPLPKQRDEVRKSLDCEDDLYHKLAWLEIDDYITTREEYVNSARENAISTYAVLKDGEWFEQGEMGWFGCSLNEKDSETWNSIHGNLLKDIPADTLITIVDCHI